MQRFVAVWAPLFTPPQAPEETCKVHVLAADLTLGKNNK